MLASVKFVINTAKKYIITQFVCSTTAFEKKMYINKTEPNLTLPKEVL